MISKDSRNLEVTCRKGEKARSEQILRKQKVKTLEKDIPWAQVYPGRTSRQGNLEESTQKASSSLPHD